MALNGSMCAKAASGRLVQAATDTLPSVFCNGVGFTTDGRLCVTNVQANIVAYNGGLPFDAQGRLVRSTIGSILGYTAGIPVTDGGMPLTTGAAAVAGYAQNGIPITVDGRLGMEIG